MSAPSKRSDLARRSHADLLFVAHSLRERMRRLTLGSRARLLRWAPLKLRLDAVDAARGPLEEARALRALLPVFERAVLKLERAAFQHSGIRSLEFT